MIDIKSELWIDKYRPNRLNEIAGQNMIIEHLKSYVYNNNIPHMLFVGPPGVGKTASSIALAKELYLGEWHENFLELNASDERGIETIRIKVKNFSKTVPSSIFNFKIIFLDESDALTIDAQTALRRIIEQYGSNCRFIFACNYINKIIDPIKSRCSILNFNKISNEEIKNYIQKIATYENISISEKSCNSIASKSNGDLRQALIMAQVLSLNKDILLQESFYDNINIDHYIPLVKESIIEALNGNFKSSYFNLINLQRENGISIYEIVKIIHNIVYTLEISNNILAQIISILGDCEHKLIAGSDEEIQFGSLIAKLTLIYYDKENNKIE